MAKSKAHRTNLQKRKRGSRAGIIAISMVAILLSCAVAYKGEELRVKNEIYQVKEDYLNKQIKQEEQRAESLGEYGKYIQTKKYIEEVAREKLGLVYSDEIMLKPEN